MFEYPIHHREIVDEFLNGRFILQSNKLFEEVKEKEGFYKSFFALSFGYQLIRTEEFAYIISDESNENLSRDISVFFAILCYELEYGYFKYKQIDELFENSSYSELITTNNK